MKKLFSKTIAGIMPLMYLISMAVFSGRPVYSQKIKDVKSQPVFIQFTYQR